jgi:hypothetical protein
MENADGRVIGKRPYTRLRFLCRARIVDHIFAKTSALRQHREVNVLPASSRFNIRMFGNIGIPAGVCLSLALMRGDNGDIR